MNELKNLLYSQAMFWIAWIIIPLIMEIIPAIADFFILIKRKIRNRKFKPLEFYPEITIIVPVYNSASTLRRCIASINDSNYPNDRMEVMLVNNKTKDNSFEIFCECQAEYKDLRINWLNAKQGKSKALNLALFNSQGKYIIHIDSDGKLDPSAVKNIVTMFENENDIHAVTGTVLTDPEFIEETKNPILRLLQKLEFGEYCHAFLAGRNFQSEFNTLFTLSGAFSAFRKSAILKTQLYNTDTVCEDTHVTFQIRDKMGKKIALCHNAVFYVDPIESLERLNVQRQRWQSGELEVLHMFMDTKRSAVKSFATDFVFRLLVFDHTFAFPRMIWYFALIVLALINYPMKLVLFSMIFLFFLYSVANSLMHICICLFLNEFDDLRHYFARKWYLIFLLPLFNFIVFWFRFAGIINSISGKQSWRVRTAREEWESFGEMVKKDFAQIHEAIMKVRNEVNIDE